MLTRHARRRVAERVKGIAPEDAAQEIEACVADGAAPVIATTCTGEDVREWWMRDTGQPVFLIVGRKSAIVSVLVEGMTVETAKGRIILEAAMVEE